MKKKIAIVQSCYIPWKGYFGLIKAVDEFVLYDDVQYTRRDWRNRNLIKTSHGLKWLTIPVSVKGKYLQKINEVKIIDKTWPKIHWKSIVNNYSCAAYFKHYQAYFEKLYFECETEDYLSQINFKFIKAICNLLNIRTKISWSTDYTVKDNLKKTERLLALCKQSNTNHYISGPSARNYIEDELFKVAGIEISYVDYTGYPLYPQLFGDFEHGVSILDLIFNTGTNAALYLERMSDPMCKRKKDIA